MREEMLSNKDYDIISVIYNASQAAETCQKYIQDAEREGDSEAREFFNSVFDNNLQLVQRGKDLLKTRLH